MDEHPPLDLAKTAKELRLTEAQVAGTIALLDEGNTVPFITRYRKEQTGNLDETQIRDVQKCVSSMRQLAERARTILRVIEQQGKLTPQLKARIEQADSLKRLEDLYQPYRKRRQSRAEVARQKGLLRLAVDLWKGDEAIETPEAAAAGYVDSERELPDLASVLKGATDILAEKIADDAEIRSRCRRIAGKSGRLCAQATKQGEQSGREFRNYFKFNEPLRRIPPHRVLAINRGEQKGHLRVRLDWDQQRAVTELAINLRLTSHRFAGFLTGCIADAVSRLIHPSLEREFRRELNDAAEEHAVAVFAQNLRNLLLQPPLSRTRVVAVDPGFRTGCKVAVLDETGSKLVDDVVFVSGSAEKRTQAREKLGALLKEHECELIAIGNGTACRETEELAAATISEYKPDARYVIVNEAGASVYSASEAAREEFPDLDATVRGTISIGRRLQDPLSELVKIDPQHLGVGMYQHDVSTKRLRESLDEVVESCVNLVGVDLNTASASLLRRVSGLNQLTARRIVEFRQQNGRFTSRHQLREVPGVGEATFTQAAGFLKVAGGEEPLDSTWIHPESYDATRRLLERLGVPAEGIGTDGAAQTLRSSVVGSEDALAAELDLGLPTFADIIESLCRPRRDPRSDQPGPLFRQDVLRLEDLHPGMELTGTVLNVVDFGAFVDVGLKDSGLVHVSQLADRFVADPHDVVSVGDIVHVWVVGLDEDRKRVQLTMAGPPEIPVAPVPAQVQEAPALEPTAEPTAAVDAASQPTPNAAPTTVDDTPQPTATTGEGASVGASNASAPSPIADAANDDSLESASAPPTDSESPIPKPAEESSTPPPHIALNPEPPSAETASSESSAGADVTAQTS